MSTEVSKYEHKNVTFVGEIVLNFSFLKKTKTKKAVTLILGIKMNGNTLKPFVVFPPSIKRGTVDSSNDIATFQAETGEIGDDCFCKWMHLCFPENFIPATKSMLIIDNCLKKLISVDTLNQIQPKTLFIPDGTACILSPLKQIAPQITDFVMQDALSEYALKYKSPLSKKKIIKWIINSILKVRKMELFELAFVEANLIGTVEASLANKENTKLLKGIEDRHESKLTTMAKLLKPETHISTTRKWQHKRQCLGANLVVTSPYCEHSLQLKKKRTRAEMDANKFMEMHDKTVIVEVGAMKTKIADLVTKPTEYRASAKRMKPDVPRGAQGMIMDGQA
jgi:hypothetical protein